MSYNLIIIAMEEELQPIKRKLQKNEHDDYYLGNNVIVVSGIGKVNASHAVTKAIYRYQKANIKQVINIGTAGSIDQAIGTIIKGDVFSYGDVDVTAFGYELGQVPAMVPKFGQGTNLVLTTDSFISDPKMLKTTQIDQVKAIEMEATAIAQVCHIENIPFTAYKVISDNANQDATAEFKQNISIVMEKLLKEVIKGA